MKWAWGCRNQQWGGGFLSREIPLSKFLEQEGISTLRELKNAIGHVEQGRKWQKMKWKGKIRPCYEEMEIQSERSPKREPYVYPKLDLAYLSSQNSLRGVESYSLFIQK